MYLGLQSAITMTCLFGDLLAPLSPHGEGVRRREARPPPRKGRAPNLIEPAGLESVQVLRKPTRETVSRRLRVQFALFPEGQEVFGLHGEQHAQEDILLALRQRTKLLHRLIPIARVGQVSRP